MQFCIFASSLGTFLLFIFVFFFVFSFVYGFCALRVRTARAAKALTYERLFVRLCVCVLPTHAGLTLPLHQCIIVSVYQCVK